MSKILTSKLNEKFVRINNHWIIPIKLTTSVSEVWFHLSDEMILFHVHTPLIRLDSAEDLQAFLTGIKGKIMNGYGEVSVSDLTDATSEEDFVKMICDIMQVDPVRLKTDVKYRGGNYPIARQLHIIVRNLAFKMTTAKAAECYGKDHCMTIYAKKIISGRREFDPAFRRLTDPIFSEIDAIISGSRRTM